MEELPDFLNLRGYAASVLSRIRDLKEWPINCLIKGRETTFFRVRVEKTVKFLAMAIIIVAIKVQNRKV